nr:MAG TPA: hypothetical protein [Caudoviricetes sp.]
MLIIIIFKHILYTSFLYYMYIFILLLSKPFI